MSSMWDQDWRGTPVTITTAWGAELTVLKEDASHYGDVLESGISWAYETSYLEPHVEPGDVVVDVGANYGYTTSYFSHECGPSGFVLSIEPEPNTRALLEHNVRANKLENVKIVACAAGASYGQIELFRSATNLANHATNRDLVPNVQDSVLVDVRTWTSCAHRDLEDAAPTVLKIDVEGWEWAVLRGSTTVIDEARPVIWLEYWPLGIWANGHDPRAVLDLMYDHGYTITVHASSCNRGSTSAGKRSSPTATKRPSGSSAPAGSSCTASSTCTRRKSRPLCDETATTSTASSTQ